MKIILFLFTLVNISCFTNNKGTDGNAELNKLFNIDKIKEQKIQQEVLRERDRYQKFGKEELKWEEDDIPKDIRNYPRIFFGKSRNEFIQSRDLEDHIFGGQKFKYDKLSNTFYSTDGIRNGSETEKEFKEYLRKNNIKNHNFSSQEIKNEGVFGLKQNDITIDILGDPDIEANAWNPYVIDKIKNKLQSEKIQAIIFERISLMPLDFSQYIIQCLKSNNDFYKLEYDNDKKLDIYKSTGLVDKKLLYKAINIEYYPQLKREKIKLDNVKYDPNIKKLDPETVYIKYTDSDSTKPSPILNLNEIIENKEHAPKNPILKEYFNILAPGGKIIFMSSSSGLHRHGGIVFKYNNSFYSPFKDLNDKNLQNLYKSIFERAGFINIKFSNDKYYKEDILYITAYKPG